MIFPSAYEAIKPSHLDNDTFENAKRYASRTMTGTTKLAYQDLPKLIKHYVTGKKALDYGCGTGFSTRLLHELGFDVVGVDISHNMLNQALAQKDGIPYALIQHAQINSSPETYDLVLSALVYFDVPSLMMIEEIQIEIHRVLKNGGIFIAVVGSEHLHVTNWENSITDIEKNKKLKSGDVYEFMVPGDNITYYDYVYSDADYKSVFESTGFKILKAHHPVSEDGDNEHKSREIKPPAQTIYVCQKIQPPV